MAFAKEYREEITLAYYCVNVALTVAAFVFGTIYLRYRDRRDQQRKEERQLAMEEKDRIDQKRKEWRHFAETIRSEYRILKAVNIPWEISKVKDTFENIQVYKGITGIDVLRFMINDPDRDECFENTELDALREDLDSIYQLLNTCASLILLGTVPNNIRADLGKLVTKLGQLALPFYKGEERDNILKCLKYFGRDFDSEKINDQEVNWKNIDDRITEDVQYVRCLRLGSASGDHAGHVQPSSDERWPLDNDNWEIPSSDGTSIHELLKKRGYGACSKFKFTFDVSALIQNNQQSLATINFLYQLHKDLEKQTYTKDFANKLRERAPDLEFIDKIARNDCDELVLVKVLHEIRDYIYIILKDQGAEALGTKRNRNIDTLRDVHESVTRIRPDEEIVRGICERFMDDLLSFYETMQPYHKSEGFKLQFEQLYDTFKAIIVIRNNDGRPTEVNYQHEIYV